MSAPKGILFGFAAVITRSERTSAGSRPFAAEHKAGGFGATDLNFKRSTCCLPIGGADADDSTPQRVSF
jgi:hypothetical protein